MDQHKEIAFYYPGIIWHRSDWIKSLILFFDGIALLVPEYLQHKPEMLDPAYVTPLRESGLLFSLKPERVVDAAATEKLANAIDALVKSGALDALPATPEFHSLSFSRLGGYADARIAENIFEILKSRGLARESEDGVSIPIHPTVRHLILTLLAQILRPYGNELNAELSPATDVPDVIDALAGLLSIPTLPSSSRVVTLDLETVGADLTNVPFDEVLAYRREHYAEHRAYTIALRKFVRELSSASEAERSEALEQRQQELRDLAAGLKRISHESWKRPARFALAALGAFWSAYHGDAFGGLISITQALIMDEKPQAQLGYYSYIFNAPGSLLS